MLDLPDSNIRSLDIGCGDGAVMERLQRMGAEVQGIDLDPQSVAIAESRCGRGSCFVSTLNDFINGRSTAARRFDLVTFFEVLEHQTDPRGFLAQVAELVSPGGTVAGSVPDRNRFLAAIDRLVDSGDLPPHHFLWFSASSLQSLLKGAGFSRIQVRRTGAISLSETHRKVRILLKRRASSLSPSLAPLAVFLSIPASLPLALVYWAGRRLRPSHLYFRCCA